VSGRRPIETFPEAEVRAGCRRWPSPGLTMTPPLKYEGITLRNVLDGKSAVAISAKPAAPVATPLRCLRPPSATGLHQPDRAPAVEYALIAPPRRVGAGRIVPAATLGLAALGLAVIGLTVNNALRCVVRPDRGGGTLARIARPRHRSPRHRAAERRRPTLARPPLGRRHRGLVDLAYCADVTLLAAMGFAATNIGDGVAGRSKVASEATGLAADVVRLRTERAAITELRSVATIEAEIQRAQPSAAAVWRQTAGCSDITLAASGAACAEILKLRQALGAAQRRDTTDTGLRNAEARLAALPAITTGDPQATWRPISWPGRSAGRVSLTPHDIHRLRITGLTIIPALAGIIFMFAVMLLRVGRRNRPGSAIRRCSSGSHRAARSIMVIPASRDRFELDLLGGGTSRRHAAHPVRDEERQIDRGH